MTIVSDLPSTPTSDAGSLFETRNLKKYFPVRRGFLGRPVGHVRAVDDISFVIRGGETLALVGESGCGKSTLARMILKLIEPTSGQVLVDGIDIAPLGPRRMRPFRHKMQIVFQDPFASLTPHMSARDIISEPLLNLGIGNRKERRARVADLLGRVGLRGSDADKYPHEFSGGQRQRIGIARALAPDPRLIVCDEAVSALDVSVQAQIINLLIGLQEEKGVAYLFVSHDLAVVEHISHRVAVMYLGKIVEIGEVGAIFDRPTHPYTEALLSAAPVPDPAASRDRRIAIQGSLPDPADPPSGCRYRTRCPLAEARCANEEPSLTSRASNHYVGLPCTVKSGAVSAAVLATGRDVLSLANCSNHHGKEKRL